MSYVDGFVLAVPAKNLAKYKKDARLAGKVWRANGALAYVECLEDDVPEGKVTSFPKAVKRKKGELIVFAYAVYKSRRHRDQVMKKVMADPRMAYDPARLPFDGKRMFWGGFKTIISQ